MKYVIANWKANKNASDAIAWCDAFLQKLQYGNNAAGAIQQGKVSVIIAPPFPLIPIVKAKLGSTPGIHIAAQSVSDVEGGSRTGEIPAATLAGLVEYAIVGHSERREHYGETNEIVRAKSLAALKQMINPLVCVRNVQDTIDENVLMVAYEPTWAIGSGKNEPVESVLEMKAMLKVASPRQFIYGGSVTEDTCAPYLHTEGIDGVLVGSASLDPAKFFSIVSQV